MRIYTCSSNSRIAQVTPFQMADIATKLVPSRLSKVCVTREVSELVHKFTISYGIHYSSLLSCIAVPVAVLLSTGRRSTRNMIYTVYIPHALFVLFWECMIRLYDHSDHS